MHPERNAHTAPFDAATLETMLEESLASLRAALPDGWSPQTLVTLGSGLGNLAGLVENPIEVPYRSIPHMPASTAPGHANRFVAGTVEGVEVLCMQGRIHPYDGLGAVAATYPVRLAARLGARAFIATNATGAVNESYRPGQVVMLNDHINLTGTNPLVGPNLAAEGPRFPDMSRAYTPRLRKLAREAAHEAGYRLEEGVYIGVTGPSFETPAEIRAFRALGADLVGMSTVWEVIVAAHCGLEVLGLSMVTNMAAGVLDEPISIEQINEAERAGSETMLALVRSTIARLA